MQRLLPSVCGLRTCLIVVLGLMLVAAPARAGTPAADFDESPFASGLSLPTAIAFLPDGRMLVTQQKGELSLVDGASVTLLTTVDVCVLPDYFEGETGLLGIAVHPDFPADRSIYLYRTKRGTDADFCGIFDFGPQPVNEVIRVTLAADDSVDPGSLEVLLTGLRVPGGFHNGGAVRIGPDRKLYVAVGDTSEGDEGGPPGTSTNPYAQDPGSLEGKILRLELDGGVPPDNPFVGNASVLDRIFAVGFRNPWRMGFDPVSGRLWVGDVGEDTVEEIDVVVAGGNYGWPRCEGTLPAGCQQAGDIDPVFAYPHAGADSLGVSVVGGAFPDGGNFAALGDHYFFADFGTGVGDGAVYRAPLNATRDGFAGPPEPVVADAGGPVDLIFGPDGALYYVSYLGGSVQRVTTSITGPPTGGGPGPEASGCTLIVDCQSVVDAARPDPGTVDKKSKKFAKKIQKFDKKADKALGKAAAASGKKQSKQYRRARKALEKLLKTARKADAKARLGVPLASLEAAVNALLAQIPTD